MVWQKEKHAMHIQNKLFIFLYDCFAARVSFVFYCFAIWCPRYIPYHCTFIGYGYRPTSERPTKQNDECVLVSYFWSCSSTRVSFEIWKLIYFPFLVFGCGQKACADSTLYALMSLGDYISPPLTIFPFSLGCNSKNWKREKKNRIYRSAISFECESTQFVKAFSYSVYYTCIRVFSSIVSRSSHPMQSHFFPLRL